MKNDKENFGKVLTQFTAISEAIEEEHGLSVEIIWSAMGYLQRHPECSIEEAIEYGFGEWVK